MITLYKLDTTGRMREWSIEVEDNKYRTISGLVDGEKVTSNWTTCYAKNEGRANSTTPAEQAQKEADAMVRIRREQGHCDTPEQALTNKSYFHPMLAHIYGDYEKKIVIDSEHEAFIQRKLDGCRCIIDRDGMWTRQGKKWISAPHIFRKLKPLFDRRPDLIFDGELYYHSEENNFNDVISLIKKTKPTPKDLEDSEKMVQYWIYDLPSCDGLFEERNRKLINIFNSNPELDSSFVYVDTYKLKNKEDIQSWLEKFVGEGYEGAIVRLNTKYECKRSKGLLKVKQFMDEEFVIVDIEEGKGNREGTAGGILVDVRGKVVSSGLHFSRDDAREIWENRDYYIGKKATIKYFSETPDHSLRFPVCIQIDRDSYE